MVATQDLKSCDQCDRAGSSPALGTKKKKKKSLVFLPTFVSLPSMFNSGNSRD